MHIKSFGRIVGEGEKVLTATHIHKYSMLRFTKRPEIGVRELMPDGGIDVLVIIYRVE